MLLQLTLDEEEFGDATKLSPREVERLSGQIVTHYKQIGRLENLDKGMMDNVDIDVKFTNPMEKAARYLYMISEKVDFSRERFSRHLTEVGLSSLVDIVIRGSYRSDADSPGASPTTANAEK